MLAVVLASPDLERLYAGLSLLVSAAADGRPARGLVSFGALDAMLDDRLQGRALRPEATPHLSAAGRETFARSLEELRDTAAALENCRLWACTAAVETTGVTSEAVQRRLDGTMSTPRFLRQVAGGDLVVV